jgi:hypothetical protein
MTDAVLCKHERNGILAWKRPALLAGLVPM